MKKVWIEPGCISCGTCEFVAPKVFTVTDISHINENASLQQEAQAIKEAAKLCPVSVIKYKE